MSSRACVFTCGVDYLVQLVESTLEWPLAWTMLLFLIMLVVTLATRSSNVFCDCGCSHCHVKEPPDPPAAVAGTQLSSRADNPEQRRTQHVESVPRPPHGLRLDELPETIMLENNGHALTVRAIYRDRDKIRLRCAWSADVPQHMLNSERFALALRTLRRDGSRWSFDPLTILPFFELGADNRWRDAVLQLLKLVQRPSECAQIHPLPLDGESPAIGQQQLDKVRQIPYNNGTGMMSYECARRRQQRCYNRAVFRNVPLLQDESDDDGGDNRSDSANSISISELSCDNGADPFSISC